MRCNWSSCDPKHLINYTDSSESLAISYFIRMYWIRLENDNVSTYMAKLWKCFKWKSALGHLAFCFFWRRVVTLERSSYHYLTLQVSISNCREWALKFLFHYQSQTLKFLMFFSLFSFFLCESGISPTLLIIGRLRKHSIVKLPIFHTNNSRWQCRSHFQFYGEI